METVGEGFPPSHTHMQKPWAGPQQPTGKVHSYCLGRQALHFLPQAASLDITPARTHPKGSHFSDLHLILVSWIERAPLILSPFPLGFPSTWMPFLPFGTPTYPSWHKARVPISMVPDRLCNSLLSLATALDSLDICHESFLVKYLPFPEMFCPWNWASLVPWSNFLSFPLEWVLISSHFTNRKTEPWSC
jgi:hypothetical protein